MTSGAASVSGSSWACSRSAHGVTKQTAAAHSATADERVSRRTATSTSSDTTASQSAISTRIDAGESLTLSAAAAR